MKKNKKQLDSSYHFLWPVYQVISHVLFLATILLNIKEECGGTTGTRSLPTALCLHFALFMPMIKWVMKRMSFYAQDFFEHLMFYTCVFILNETHQIVYKILLHVIFACLNSSCENDFYVFTCQISLYIMPIGILGSVLPAQLPAKETVHQFFLRGGQNNKNIHLAERILTS